MLGHVRVPFVGSNPREPHVERDVLRLCPVFHDGASRATRTTGIPARRTPHRWGRPDLRLRDSAGIRPASPAVQDSLRRQQARPTSAVNRTRVRRSSVGTIDPA